MPRRPARGPSAASAKKRPARARACEKRARRREPRVEREQRRRDRARRAPTGRRDGGVCATPAETRRGSFRARGARGASRRAGSCRRACAPCGKTHARRRRRGRTPGLVAKHDAFSASATQSGMNMSSSSTSSGSSVKSARRMA